MLLRKMINKVSVFVCLGCEAHKKTHFGVATTPAIINQVEWMSECYSITFMQKNVAIYIKS